MADTTSFDTNKIKTAQASADEKSAEQQPEENVQLAKATPGVEDLSSPGKGHLAVVVAEPGQTYALEGKAIRYTQEGATLRIHWADGGHTDIVHFFDVFGSGQPGGIEGVPYASLIAQIPHFDASVIAPGTGPVVPTPTEQAPAAAPPRPAGGAFNTPFHGEFGVTGIGVTSLLGFTELQFHLLPVNPLIFPILPKSAQAVTEELCRNYAQPLIDKIFANIPEIDKVADRPGPEGYVVNGSGGTGNDYLYGSDNANDYINGYGGNDQIYGEGGDDVLIGGDGDDVLHGGAGNDWLEGDGGSDKLFGGAGNDILFGSGDCSPDLLVGDFGDRSYLYVTGAGDYGEGAANDFNDYLNGNGGNDLLIGDMYGQFGEGIGITVRPNTESTHDLFVFNDVLRGGAQDWGRGDDVLVGDVYTDNCRGGSAGNVSLYVATPYESDAPVTITAFNDYLESGKILVGDVYTFGPEDSDDGAVSIQVNAEGNTDNTIIAFNDILVGGDEEVFLGYGFPVLESFNVQQICFPDFRDTLVGDVYADGNGEVSIDVAVYETSGGEGESNASHLVGLFNDQLTAGDDIVNMEFDLYGPPITRGVIDGPDGFRMFGDTLVGDIFQSTQDYEGDGDVTINLGVEGGGDHRVAAFNDTITGGDDVVNVTLIEGGESLPLAADAQSLFDGYNGFDSMGFSSDVLVGDVYQTGGGAYDDVRINIYESAFFYNNTGTNGIFAFNDTITGGDGVFNVDLVSAEGGYEIPLKNTVTDGYDNYFAGLPGDTLVGDVYQIGAGDVDIRVEVEGGGLQHICAFNDVITAGADTVTFSVDGEPVEDAPFNLDGLFNNILVGDVYSDGRNAEGCGYGQGDVQIGVYGYGGYDDGNLEIILFNDQLTGANGNDTMVGDVWERNDGAAGGSVKIDIGAFGEGFGQDGVGADTMIYAFNDHLNGGVGDDMLVGDIYVEQTTHADGRTGRSADHDNDYDHGEVVYGSVASGHDTHVRGSGSSRYAYAYGGNAGGGHADGGRAQGGEAGGGFANGGRAIGGSVDIRLVAEGGGDYYGQGGDSQIMAFNDVMDGGAGEDRMVGDVYMESKSVARAGSADGGEANATAWGGKAYGGVADGGDVHTSSYHAKAFGGEADGGRADGGHAEGGWAGGGRAEGGHAIGGSVNIRLDTDGGGYDGGQGGEQIIDVFNDHLTGGDGADWMVGDVYMESKSIAMGGSAQGGEAGATAFGGVAYGGIAYGGHASTSGNGKDATAYGGYADGGDADGGYAQGGHADGGCADGGRADGGAISIQLATFGGGGYGEGGGQGGDQTITAFNDVMDGGVGETYETLIGDMYMDNTSIAKGGFAQGGTADATAHGGVAYGGVAYGGDASSSRDDARAFGGEADGGHAYGGFAEGGWAGGGHAGGGHAGGGTIGVELTTDGGGYSDGQGGDQTITAFNDTMDGGDGETWMVGDAHMENTSIAKGGVARGGEANASAFGGVAFGGVAFGGEADADDDAYAHGGDAGGGDADGGHAEGGYAEGGVAEGGCATGGDIDIQLAAYGGGTYGGQGGDQTITAFNDVMDGGAGFGEGGSTLIGDVYMGNTSIAKGGFAYGGEATAYATGGAAYGGDAYRGDAHADHHSNEHEYNGQEGDGNADGGYAQGGHAGGGIAHGGYASGGTVEIGLETAGGGYDGQGGAQTITAFNDTMTVGDGDNWMVGDVAMESFSKAFGGKAEGGNADAYATRGVVHGESAYGEGSYGEGSGGSKHEYDGTADGGFAYGGYAVGGRVDIWLDTNGDGDGGQGGDQIITAFNDTMEAGAGDDWMVGDVDLETTAIAYGGVACGGNGKGDDAVAMGGYAFGGGVALGIETSGGGYYGQGGDSTVDAFNDRLMGGDGDNTLIGDVSLASTTIATDGNAYGEGGHDGGGRALGGGVYLHVANAGEGGEGGQAGKADIRAFNDTLVAGLGADLLVGDVYSDQYVDGHYAGFAYGAAVQIDIAAYGGGGDSGVGGTAMFDLFNDTLSGGGGDDLLVGDVYHTQVVSSDSERCAYDEGGVEMNVFYKEGGNDGQGGNATITAFNDVMHGGDGHDLMVGDVYADGGPVNLGIETGSSYGEGGGAAHITAFNDVMTGDGGDDCMVGDVLTTGNDVHLSIYADTDDNAGNTISAFNDDMNGGDGNDLLVGDVVNLQGEGWGHIDVNVSDNGEADTAISAFNDNLDGGTGEDVLIGDFVVLNEASVYDFCHGDLEGIYTEDALHNLYDSLCVNLSDLNENDSVFNDTMNGGDGNDILWGQLGNDILTGGTGADTFLYANADNSENLGDGHDTITDFSHGGDGDVVDLDALFDQLGIAGGDARASHVEIDTSSSPGNSVLTIHDTGGVADDFSITFSGVDLGAGTAGSFNQADLATKGIVVDDS